MYKRTAKRIVKRWPVTITEAGDDGKVMKREVKVDFEVIKQDELDAVYSAGGNDAQLLDRVVLGWDDQQFQDEDGTPLLFNKESCTKLWAENAVRQAFVQAFLTAFNGREPARKN